MQLLIDVIIIVYVAESVKPIQYIDMLESINAKTEEMQPRKGIPAIFDWRFSISISESNEYVTVQPRIFLLE